MTKLFRKFNSLSHQIIIFVFVFIFLLLAVSTLLTRVLMSRVMFRSAEENMEYLANQNIFQIETRLKKIQAHAQDLMYLVSQNSSTSPIIETYIYKLLKANPEIDALCLAWEPASPNSPPLAAIYAYANDRQVLHTYENRDYLYKDWFCIPILNNKEYWSEPWFEDKVVKHMVSSFSIPFITTTGTKGIIRIDLPLSYFQRMILPPRFKTEGYAFLITHHGTLVTHPADSLVMNESIFSLAQTHNDMQLRQIGKDMVNGGSGFEELKGSKFTKNKWIYYAPMISNSWSLGIVIFDRVVYQDLNTLFLINSLIAVLAFIILAFVIYARTTHINQPLKALIDSAEQIGAGNFDAEIPKPSSITEISMLEDALKSMQTSLKDYVKNLRQTTEEKNKIQTEVRFASEIQRNLIPKLDNPLNNTTELRIHGILEPAREVGGDLYDYFMIEEDRFCFVIADVLGKGIAASMSMVMVSTMIRSLSKQFNSVGKTLKELNLFLCENNLEANFVTMIMGVINLRTGELEFSNAGHVPLYIRKANRRVVKYADTHSTALGIFPNLNIISDSIQLDLGDEIILITDGITEAMSKNEAFFGYQRLENILEELTVSKPEYTAKSILNGVRSFSGKDHQSDDITILVIDFIHPKRKLGRI